jgi:hypothetical protein
MELSPGVIEGLQIAGNRSKIPDKQFAILLKASAETLLDAERIDLVKGESLYK